MPFDREATPGAGAAENYYDVLGLRPGATDEEIEEAYADLAAMFAPGKVPAARQDYARKQRARLAAAYAVLADPDQRAAYDSRLSGATSLPAASPAAPAPAAEAELPAVSAPDAVEEATAAEIPASVAPDAAAMASPEAQAAADGPVLAPVEPPPAPTLTVAPVPSAPPVAESPVAADDAREAEPVVDGQTAEQATARLPEIEAEESEPLADVDEAEEPDVEASAEPDEDEDLAPWQTPPPPAPTRAAPARPAPAKPAPKARPAAAPTAPPSPAPVPRPGGVALPNRREAAQIAARKPAAPAPAAPAPPARPGVQATRQMSTAARPAPARPATTRRVMTDDGEEELLAPRVRTARAAPPPPRKRKRNNTNRFAYQVMTLVIALVLIVGTAASFLSTTITPAVLDTPTPAAGAAAPLVAAGISAAQAGQWSQAEQDFQQALQIDPQNVPATLGLAQVYMSKTPPDLQQANAYAQQVIRLAPASDEATTARNLLAALSLTPQSTATTSSGAATTPAAAAPTIATTPAP